MQRHSHITQCLLMAVWLLAACTIQPPLHLAPDPENIAVETQTAITDMDMIWGVEADWHGRWYYGWDEEDIRQMGPIAYPTPTNFEVRRYFTGDIPAGPCLEHDGFTIWTRIFRRHFIFGYYDMLIWSNIDSPDGTQTVFIDESDIENVMATTTTTRVSYKLPPATPTRSDGVRNQPDIFYDNFERGFYISRDIADYDYFDETEQVWVKVLRTELIPVVYIYLVQVILHNNDGRIVGLSDMAAISGLADGVNLNTRITTVTDANITYLMRMKTGLNCEGETCDIIGGRLTTYGLCGMQPWVRARGAEYDGTRGDVQNVLTVPLRFASGQTLAHEVDVTAQMQSQSHGGIITVHIDAGTLTPPDTPPSSPGGNGFIPTVEDYEEHEDYEFGI